MALPPVHELAAEPSWRSVDLISDLHLQDSEPATFEAWRRYLASPGADAIVILGDLFEAWPGDDVLQVPGFSADCAAVLRAASAARPVFFMHGNRDFLVGEAFAQATGVQLLPDPTVLAFGGQRWLLSHADALCLGDVEYLRFREQVRDPKWQRALLARPLAERQALARSLRAKSEGRKRSGATYADVDTDAARAWLAAARATVLVHGHTHRPAEHDLGDGLRRVVLTDWDLQAQPPRAQALRLSVEGRARRVPLA
ncbi:UDP-2,3-diacylglucosamine diphosphatase [Ramlibacter sp. Leaf400]|uniref:UDP-2,3-diacylglucosamine diphosphatase n=1 Tax=Ramlibacter sp. Leaf400 TaxID=1736365 RepID=UPI0006FA8CCB|nr:UDP-2,3-diacylglucosamine diphosphatase [Ramlibacter sp. Leaf400]KQT10342.1 UDP-2,3-diacylglucosamine hydrolase [Ramlibacter sp. Leaf400]